ncbi:MAG: ATPase, T2SS/T4P/T4SS family, partial [Lysobacterales bacterium]
MTPRTMQARADLAQFESQSSSTQVPAAKPQIRLVKIDGKLTAVPVQENEQTVEPIQEAKPVEAVERLQPFEPVEAVERLHTAKPLEAVECIQVAEPTQPDKSATLSYGPGVNLRDLLQQAIEQNASDLHVHSGAMLRLRVGGKFCDATPDVLSSDECEKLIMAILNESQLKQLKEKFQVDFACEIQGVGRFRANIYKQQRGYDAVFRAIKPSPPTLAELGLPKEFEQYTEFHQGLLLFTGPAGCGKSSTMAAMANLINQRRADHILTIEDPIEYVHNSDLCNVTQREVGAQTESFPTALRAALR